MGREKFDAKMRDRYCDIVSRGATRQAAAEEVGVSYRTVWGHLRKYPAFAEKLCDSEAGRTAEVRNALYTAAVEDGNVPAMIFWLRSREPDEWYDPRKLSVEQTAPLQVQIEYIDAPAPDEDD